MKRRAIPWVTQFTSHSVQDMAMRQVKNLRLAAMWICGVVFTLACKDSFEPEQPCLDNDCMVDFSQIDVEAAWSPDGQWIAFTHADSSKTKRGIWLIKPDGTGARLWQRGWVTYPAWSPDGQWIAFESGGQIWKRKVNGDSLTRLTGEGEYYYPTWSPDGKQLAFDSNSQSAFYAVMTMDSDGGNQSLIGYDQLTGGGSRQPHWARVGQIVHYRSYTVDSDIFIMDTKGGNLKRLTSDDKTNREPKLSPDGGKVVYTSMDYTPGGLVGPGIFMMDASGLNAKMLAHPGTNATWSPDGKMIVYTQSSAANGRLWLMSSDGSGKRQLTFKEQF